MSPPKKAVTIPTKTPAVLRSVALPNLGAVPGAEPPDEGVEVLGVEVLVVPDELDPPERVK